MSKNTIPAKTLIISSGRFPELIFVKSGNESELPEQNLNDSVCWEGIEPYKHPDSANESGFFAKGDAVTDYSAAVKAIGAGRRAAASIHKLMYGISLDLPENVINERSIVQDIDHIENVKSVSRRIMPLCDIKDMEWCREFEKGFDETTALAEADRCLQCGLICYRNSNN